MPAPTLIDSMLSRYEISTQEFLTRALREVMQEVALAGLYRGGFFDHAAFYGGTCLRIFHQLPRFSEDLDFSLLKPNSNFSFEPYFDSMRQEFIALGIDVDIQEKQRVSDIQSAFLKKTSSAFDMRLAGQKNIKIKFEVDTNPPLPFSTESKLLLQPFSFYVRCFALPDLFAGKMHAVLYRAWKQRVKGRDWFDFEWYVRHSVPLNLAHYEVRARQSGHIEKALSPERFRQDLLNRIEMVNFNTAVDDIKRFVVNPGSLDIWSADYFRDLVDHIQFTDC